jgi:hypothetical protein
MCEHGRETNMNEGLDYAAIRRRVEEGLKQEKRRSKWGMFIANAIMFVMFNAIAWGYMLLSSSGMTEREIGLMAMLSIGYGMAVLFHLMTILMDGGSMEKQLRERVMARELQHEMLRLGEEMEAEPPAKRKRDAAYRLSDDGELLEIIDDEDAPEQRRSA